MDIKKLIKKFIPRRALNWYHLFLPLLGVFLYRFPSKKIKVIGVTGTNGKTTAVHLISEILEQAGYKVASVSSIRFKIGDREYKNVLKMTMPGRLKLQRFLRKAVDSKCDFMVLEVTSEGIKQHRHRFIDFDAAVFTNLTKEHIESHGSFEKYKQAKGELFRALNPRGISIVNLDDKNADYFLGLGTNRKIGYTIKKSGAEARILNRVQGSNIKVIAAENCELSAGGIKFSINGIEFDMRLLGEFNIYNALSAVCVGVSYGIDMETCKTALEGFDGMPGRMEIVSRAPFYVIVDYAHTPDALEKVYQTIKQLSCSSRIIGVIGAAGGGRDKWKRPELGRVADKYCDQIIITNEDPYDEDPKQILEAIGKGISGREPIKIIDRELAIKKALSLAGSGDAVVITGKGSEPWMCVARNKKIPWDDRAIARQALKTLY